ncbi:hypothetical protein SBA6_480005 [Candidatus Sulfopaludibacter sp. SbA6]|nr:hypothetical protein SBA6_480005 [Candidatus Sulfopaludibacter sp. SbA6]
MGTPRRPMPNALSHQGELGIVRGPKESLAETTARAMGISVREFRAELQRRAAGITAGPYGGAVAADIQTITPPKAIAAPS